MHIITVQTNESSSIKKNTDNKCHVSNCPSQVVKTKEMFNNNIHKYCWYRDKVIQEVWNKLKGAIGRYAYKIIGIKIKRKFN